MQKLNIFSYFKQRIKCVGFTAVLAVFVAFCLCTGIYFAATGHAASCVKSFLFILIVPALYIIEYLLGVKLTPSICALLLIIPVGSILGAGFNLYTVIPYLDTIMHTLSGFVFACFGFSVMKIFIGEPKSNRAFFAYLLFGVAFSLLIAVLWELYEFTCDALFGGDLQEDTVIKGFYSFKISGDHGAAFDASGIDKTVIHFADGREAFEFDGYLDIGLIDTIIDMAVCFLGSLIYFVLFALDWFKSNKTLNKVFIPGLTTQTVGQTAEEEQLSLFDK